MVEAKPGDRPIDRQALDPVEQQLPMPRRPELHFVRKAFQIVSEVELFQIPRIRGDELDWVQRPRAYRRLVLDRLDLLQGAANPEFVDRLLACGVDIKALQEARSIRHPSGLVERLDRLQE